MTCDLNISSLLRRPIGDTGLDAAVLPLVLLKCVSMLRCFFACFWTDCVLSCLQRLTEGTLTGRTEAEEEEPDRKESRTQRRRLSSLLPGQQHACAARGGRAELLQRGAGPGIQVLQSRL